MSIRVICFFVILPIISSSGQTTYAQNSKSSGNGSSGGSQTTSNSGTQGGSSKSGSTDGSKSQTSDITVGDNSGKIESYVLAAGALHQAAQQIASRILMPEKSAIVLYDQVDHDRLQALAQFRAKFSIVDAIYSRALKPLPDAVQTLPQETSPFRSQSLNAASDDLTVVETMAETAVKLLSLFKSTTTVNGLDVTLDDESLVDEVSSALLTKHITVLRPELYFPDLLSEADIGKSLVIANIETLLDDKESALQQIASFKADIDALSIGLKNTPDTDTAKKAVYNRLIQSRKSKLSELEAANSAFDALIGSVLSATDANSANIASSQGNQGGSNSCSSSGDDQACDLTSGDNSVAPPANGKSAQQGQSMSASSSDQPCFSSSASPIGQKSPSKNNPSPSPGQTSNKGKSTGISNNSTGTDKNSMSPAKSTPDGTQPEPTLVGLVYADLLEAKIRESGLPILTLKIDQSGGGYMTKSSFFTFFTGPVQYHMGGTVVSFNLLSSSSGGVLASGTFPVYGGYVKSTNVKSTVTDLMK